MSNVWFRCSICGTQMLGDPRFPPVCPNTARHPRQQPGQLPQQVIYLPPRPPTWRERYRAYNQRRRSEALKALGMMFAFGLGVLVVLIIIRAVLALFLGG